MHYEQPKGQIYPAAVEAAKKASALMSQTEREMSPIESKISQLHSMLQCAHEGMHLLATKLAPIRSFGPGGDAGCTNSPEAPCELEQNLQHLIDSAAELSARISDLRAELRI